MPLINVKLIEGVFSSDQKQQIIERLTDAMVSIEGENMRQVTWCVVEEVKSGDWESRATRSRPSTCTRSRPARSSLASRPAPPGRRPGPRSGEGSRVRR
jgi:4-oxalocrotonate tautomerase